VDDVKADATVRHPRASITFPLELYRSLEGLARDKKVSLAWVIREAAEAYVAEQSRDGGDCRGLIRG
jgi:predicted DNA-binding protein